MPSKNSPETPASKRPNLKTVAAAAGLGTSTVADILRGDPATLARYNADTVKRVRATAQKLDYRPNRMAAALVSGKSRTVMLLSERAYEPYFARVARQMEAHVRRDGYEMFVVDAAHFDASRAGLWPVDGILAVEGESWPEVAMALRPHPATPLVSLGTCGISGFDQVRLDMAGAMTEATVHLQKQGAKSILYLDQIALSTTNFSATYQKPYEAYADAMTKAGLAHARIESADSGPAAGRIAVLSHAWENPLPDAILCRTDDLAIGAARAIAELGKVVGRDILLVGCNGMDEMAFLSPSISTLAFPLETMTAEAWRMLRERMEPRLSTESPAEIKMLRVPLVVRESSAAHPVR
jgi:DNA-binding LacI/PurR family transcriptional regulator